MQHIPTISFGWTWPLVFIAYMIMAMYGYAPLRVKRNQCKPIHVEYAPISLQDVPQDISNVFSDAYKWLDSNRFQLVGIVRRQEVNSAQESYVSLWTNQSLTDSAQIIGILTPSARGGVKVVTLVTFRTEFSDGTAIVTTNSASLSCFPVNPRVNSIRCPKVHDLTLLYRFHRARVARDKGVRLASFIHTQDTSKRLQFEHQETFGRLVEANYYVVNEATESYDPTYKGAYLMTYRLLPPLKQMQQIRKNHLADRTLRDLGFGGLAAAQQSYS